MYKKDIADQIGVSEKTVDRRIKEGHKHQEWLDLVNDGQPFPHGKNDIIPPKAAEYLIVGKRAPAPPFAANIQFSTIAPGFIAYPDQKTAELHMNTPPDIADEFDKAYLDKMNELLADEDNPFKGIEEKTEKVVDTVDTRVKETITDRQTGRQTSPLSDRILLGDIPAVLTFASFVAADIFSCSWIAFQAFDGFWPSVVFFGLIGAALAYASIRNAITMTGWDADQWLWGFSIFQFLLHMAAFQMFDAASYDNWSNAVGKIVICICMPMGTTGIAITFRKSSNKFQKT